MPHITRLAMHLQAKSMRETGELVYLVIPNESTPSTNTPLDIVGSNESIDWSTVTTQPIYAFVSWHKLGGFKYEAGGRVAYRKANIETTAEWMTQLQGCIGVKLQNGTYMRKCEEDIDDSKAAYTIVVEGTVNVSL